MHNYYPPAAGGLGPGDVTGAPDARGDDAARAPRPPNEGREGSSPGEEGREDRGTGAAAAAALGAAGSAVDRAVAGPPSPSATDAGSAGMPAAAASTIEDDTKIAMAANENGVSYEKFLDTDTFSVMMTSKIWSSGWVLGIITFLFQIALSAIILTQLVSDGFLESIPIWNSTQEYTTIGQFFAVALILVSQNDPLSAVDFLMLFWSSKLKERDASFYVLLIENDQERGLRPDPTDPKEKATRSQWFYRAILPNLLKFVQGILVFAVSLIVVIQADELIDLLKDFAALHFVSDIDNYCFWVAERGFFGPSLMRRALKVQHVKIKVNPAPTAGSAPAPLNRTEKFKIIYFALWAIIAFPIIGVVKSSQYYGRQTKIKFPYCKPKDAKGELMREDHYLERIGDDTCHGWLNTPDCDFDGGDCISFNVQFPQCPVRNHSYLGDGFCNGGPYNTIGCNQDDGDCEDCPSVPTSEKETNAIATADFDQDGSIDILVGNCWLSNQILWNNGKGEFAQENIMELSSTLDGYAQCTTAIAAADLNNDKLVDIVVARKLSKWTSINVILWNSGGRQGFTEQVLPGSGKIDSQAVQLVDLNNDTLPEIIFGNSKGHNSTIFWNKGNKTFDEIPMPRTNDVNTDFSSSEMFNTTSILVVAALKWRENEDQNYKNYIHLGNFDQPNAKYAGKKYSEEKFKEFMLEPRETPPSKTVSMVMLPVEELTAFETFTILSLNDDGNHEVSGNTPRILADNNDLKEARFADIANMDGSGLEEMVTASDYGVSNRVFFFVEGNVPTIKSSIDLPCTSVMDTKSIALADLDGDGNIDVIMGNYRQRNQVLLNFLGDGKTYKQPGDDPDNVWLPEISFGYKYPNCKRIVDSLTAEMLINGICDIYNHEHFYNEECGWDGGECEKTREFTKKHPKCDVSDLNVAQLGDGFCHNANNSEECGWDDGDCEDYHENYPDCDISWGKKNIGNGFCNGGDFNKKDCGYDGGDCDDFNAKYPGCEVEGYDDVSMINNDECDGKYNTQECKFDGGDCIEFNKLYPDCKVEKTSKLGDGTCDDKTYNSLECGFDGGDCDQFEKKYPNCTTASPHKIGDGLCDRGPSYYTKQCGWDGGDCSFLINDQANLTTLTDAKLADIYNIGHKEVEVTTEEGLWVAAIELPYGNNIPEGSKFRIKCNSFEPVRIQYEYKHGKCKRRMMKMVKYNEKLDLVKVGDNWYEEDGPIIFYPADLYDKCSPLLLF